VRARGSVVWKGPHRMIGFGGGVIVDCREKGNLKCVCVRRHNGRVGQPVFL
jgi:hypothetical protein